MHYLLSLNLPVDHQDTAEGQESIKAKLNAIRSKLVRQVSDGDVKDIRPPCLGYGTFTAFTRLGVFPTGSLSHRAARRSGHDRQLPAETGREVHDVLSAELQQARLLQAEAGTSTFMLSTTW